MTYDAPVADPTKPTEGEVVMIAGAMAGWAQLVGARDLDDQTPASPTPTAYGWLRAGVLAQERGDTDDAIRHYGQAVDVDPDYLRAHIALGIARAEVVDSLNAIRVLREASERVGSS